MNKKTEIIWALLLIVTAVVSFFLGTRTGTLETENNLRNTSEQKTEEITVLKNKIQQLSNELTSRGIFSYPQASIVSESRDSSPSVLIVLNGREPIKNLEIERKIFQNYSKNTDENSEVLKSNGRTTYLGNLNAHNPIAFEIEDFKNEIGIDLTFKSGQNQWHQFIRTSKTQEGEMKTFWIITNKDSEVIDKHIDEGFPLDNTGNLTFGPDRKVKYQNIKMNSTFLPYPVD